MTAVAQGATANAFWTLNATTIQTDAAKSVREREKRRIDVELPYKETRMPADKINDTVRQCLSNCADTPHPHLGAAEFLADLRRNSDWSQDEADQVSAAVSILLPRDQ